MLAAKNISCGPFKFLVWRQDQVVISGVVIHAAEKAVKHTIILLIECGDFF